MSKKIMRYERRGYAHITEYDDGTGSVSFDPIYPAQGVIVEPLDDDGPEWKMVDTAVLANKADESAQPAFRILSKADLVEAKRAGLIADYTYDPRTGAAMIQPVQHLRWIALKLEMEIDE